MQAVSYVAAILRRAPFIVIAAIGLSAATGACAECMELGGKETCNAQKPPPTWSIGVCTEIGAFTSDDIAWCQVRGGTWTNNGCVGGTPDTEDNVQQRVVQHSEIFLGTTCSLASDTGWHSTAYSPQCAGGNLNDLYHDGWLTR